MSKKPSPLGGLLLIAAVFAFGCALSEARERSMHGSPFGFNNERFASERADEWAMRSMARGVVVSRPQP